MPNPFSDYGVSDHDFDIAVHGPEVLKARIKLARQARTYWRRIAPVETGTYRDSIEVTVDGDNVRVGSNDPKANLIEYGTVDTPEFACRAKVQAHFGLVADLEEDQEV